MKLVIDISHNLYDAVFLGHDLTNIAWRELHKAVKNGKTLKKGYWINIEERTDWYDATYKCSCCGREIITPYELKNNLYSDYPYCHCGAKMETFKESK